MKVELMGNMQHLEKTKMKELFSCLLDMKQYSLFLGPNLSESVRGAQTLAPSLASDEVI
jgi:hypothetical protein